MFFNKFIILCFLTLIIFPSITLSATFTVNETSDVDDQNLIDDICDSSPAEGNQCTLRAAVQQANQRPDQDLIILESNEYLISLGELQITQSLTIEGKGAGNTIINGNENSRIFIIPEEIEVNFIGLTIKKGKLITGDAPAIKNENGIVSIIKCDVSENINENGEGGAISNSGKMTILDSIIHSNIAVTGGGGGIINDSINATLVIDNSTISSNFSLDNGGGIEGAGSIQISSSTVVFNESSNGGGLSTIDNIVFISNSIIALNSSSDPDRDDLEGINTIFQSEGHNLIGVNNLFYISQPSDITGTVGGSPLNPLIEESLINNGGPTLTHALQPGSPAINQGDNENCPKTDQRGFGRPVDSLCDIGAFEFNAVAIACGDGILQEDEGEECDDGNDDNEDQCSNECTINSNFSPEPEAEKSGSSGSGGCGLATPSPKPSASLSYFFLVMFTGALSLFFKFNRQITNSKKPTCH